MDTALELTGVGKSFGAVRALSEVDLTVRRGEVHCVLGENGAGKSTLCNLVYGGVGLDEGHMRLFGEPYRPRKPADALRGGIAMVHQHFSLVPTLTVAENLMLGEGARLRLPRRELATRVAAIEDEFGLRVELGARAEALSVGERQTVEIVKCLLRDPQLVLLDEPTAVLGPTEIDALLGTCRRIAESGRAVVLVTHKLGEIERAGDSATVLRGGRVAGAGPLKSFGRGELVELMVGRELVDLDALLVEGDSTARTSRAFAPARSDDGIAVSARGDGTGAAAVVAERVAASVRGEESDSARTMRPSAAAAAQDAAYQQGRGTDSQVPQEFSIQPDVEMTRGAQAIRSAEGVGDGALAGRVSTDAEVAPVVRVTGLRLSRPDGAPVLDGVELELRPGEITGIAGVEGNGQSELVAVLSGARRPEAGEFWLGDTDLTHASPAVRTAHGLGVIPEDRHHEGCIPGMSIAENLTLGRLREFHRRGFLDRRAIEAAAVAVIAEHGVKASSPRAAMRTLSGGNQQKVVIARELALDPLRCLVAAQPTRGLDLGAVDAVLTRLREAAAAGAAVLVVSHELSELLALCDRVLVAYRGRLLCPVDPADTRAREQIAHLMLGTTA